MDFPLGERDNKKADVEKIASYLCMTEDTLKIVRDQASKLPSGSNAFPLIFSVTILGNKKKNTSKADILRDSKHTEQADLIKQLEDELTVADGQRAGMQPKCARILSSFIAEINMDPIQTEQAKVRVIKVLN